MNRDAQQRALLDVLCQRVWQLRAAYGVTFRWRGFMEAR